jgi:hypothetical protein
MAFRPYPDADRARHQLDRHAPTSRTIDGLTALRGWSLSSPQAARALANRADAIGEALRHAQPNGARAMENIAAALGRMPKVADLFPSAARSDPGSGT